MLPRTWVAAVSLFVLINRALLAPKGDCPRLPQHTPLPLRHSNLPEGMPDALLDGRARGRAAVMAKRATCGKEAVNSFVKIMG